MDRDAVSSQLERQKAQYGSEARATTSNGAPVDSLTASMTVGPRGDIVLKDFTLLDHLAHFDRERIPERVVHAKGAGAFGYFEVTSTSFTKFCKAKMFSTAQKRTPVALRFSTVGGESGSADTARDPRGYAVKFYTEDGNWDLVGNNTPIFFIRDPILFPSFIHTQKRNPATHCKDADMMWDFISLRPETTHQVSFLFSDRGLPDGYRHLNGYGSHTFKTVNAAGDAYYVKWHFKTDQGIKVSQHRTDAPHTSHVYPRTSYPLTPSLDPSPPSTPHPRSQNLSPEEAERLSAADPDYAIRDLYNAIARGDCPSWTLYAQVRSKPPPSLLPSICRSDSPHHTPSPSFPYLFPLL